MKYDEKALKAAQEAFIGCPYIPSDRELIGAISAYCEKAGVVMVPREPTDVMCFRGYHAPPSFGMADNSTELYRQQVGPVYAAMISASQEEE
jgi:hypothetical protein